MKCPSCNNENRIEAMFCRSCGTSLVMSTQINVDNTSINENMIETEIILESPLEEINEFKEASDIIPPSLQNTTALTTEKNLCRLCGSLISLGMKFCYKCGKKQLVSINTPNDKVDVKKDVGNISKKMPVQKVLLVVIPVILIVLTLIIFVPTSSGNNFSFAKDSISFFPDDDKIYISGSNNSGFTIEGSSSQIQVSIDRKKAAVLTDNNGVSGGTLWLVTTSNAKRIADDVFDFQISASGNGVIYLTDYNNRNNTATLYLYNTSSNKASRITDDAVYFSGYNLFGICISPDGKSVGYISDYDIYSNEFIGYIKVDGKATERLGNNSYAMALSDSGKIIYYVKMSDNGRGASLHSRRGRTENRLVPDMPSHDLGIYLNRDYSEIIFSVDNKTYISRNGGEREILTSNHINGLFINPETKVMVSGNVTIYEIRTFKNTIINSNNRLEYINSRFETERISGINFNETRQMFLSQDGKTLFFLTDGILSRIDPSKLNAERTFISRSVSSFIASNDGKTIYYVDYNEDLWRVRGNGNPSKVANFVSSRHLAIFNNNAFFIIDYNSRSGGDLHFSNNGRSSKKIAGDVMNVWSSPTGVFYLTRDSEYYRSNGNSNFSLLNN